MMGETCLTGALGTTNGQLASGQFRQFIFTPPHSEQRPCIVLKCTPSTAPAIMTQESRDYNRWAIGLGAVTAAAVATVWLKAGSIRRGTRRGPPAFYHLTPRAHTARKLPSQLDPTLAQYYYVRVRTPTDLADPLSAFVRAFYAHPYFALEGGVARRWGYLALPRAQGLSLSEVAPGLSGPSVSTVDGTEPPGTTFVGIFTMVERSEYAALMYWTTPEKLLRERTDAVAGGTHELAAVKKGDGLELSLGTTHFTLGGAVGPSSGRYLEWDSRYLLYSASRRLECWAKDGKV